ncbi:MAG: hypothetical protein HYV27_19490 [Candidatus Hydrogenedentes bacterium]|nr:hypothetical protein [Candidatus Hydrogenedentota bacterium]
MRMYSTMRLMMLVLAACSLGLVAAAQEPAPKTFGVDQLQERVPEQHAPAETEPQPEAPADPAESSFEDLDLTARIAQLMVVMLEGQQSPTVSDLGFMDAYVPGGVVIRQIINPAHATIYIAKLKGIELKSGLPILIGGNIYDLTRRDRNAPSAFVQLPTLLSLAATRSEAQADALGSLLGRHMASMGFNFHLGPSLALAPDLAEAQGSIDSLGGDPVWAAKLGASLIRQFQTHQIIPVPMGFPGGGFNRVERSPAVLLTPRNQLAERELLPYTTALALKLPLINVGSTLVPTLEPKPLPACMSRVVMTEILRGELGFEGVILAGPLDSYDITATFDAADAAIQALKNGADMIYWERGPGPAMRCIERIEKAVNEGALDKGLINAAVYRVLKLKHGLSATPPPALKEDQLTKLNSEKKVVDAAYQIERQGITLVQNRGQVLPLSKERSMPIGITGTVYFDELHKTMQKYAKPISEQRIATAGHLGEIQAFEIERLTSHIRGLRTVVCVFTDALRPEGQTALVRALREKGIQVVVVLLGYPRNLDALAEADALLLAYCDGATYPQTLRAIGETLMGEGPVGIAALAEAIPMRTGEIQRFSAIELMRVPPGRLPVAHSDTFPLGHGLTYDPRQSFKKAEWDFGNGKHVKKEQVEYAYPQAGRYPLSLTVTGLHGETARQTFDIAVEDDAP